ncbi:xanthine dehydrogenase molybdopterin binding subunit [Oceanicella actignis]|uniref:xanthine dehydrogenase molybdopterin binding subunit n=1 Tax=Oceanicella actignis TaxID=1189325 RepID=UPI0011E60CC2|nr:xanthine dehydrogenase molybdopterin binding subunit [Oceanicella actignis]TYO89497.1 xanthine dehydrogenase molybdenum binding subunit apoprotein [Oceanicella actignis]
MTDPERIKGGVATPVPHDSAVRHVRGEAVYVDDIPEPPGCLHAAFGLSERAHARILELDLSEVREAPGVVAVLTARDLPGANDVSASAHDEPLLAEDEVLFHGQPIFAVIAESHLAARRAARKARIRYQDLPAILTIDQALAAGSLLEPMREMVKGDPEAALAAAPRRLRGRVELGGQEHFYLEGQAALSVPGEGDEMTVHASSQHPTEIQHKVAETLGVPFNAVTVIVRRMGGGFGGKESQGNAPACLTAAAARLLGRPVKMRYDRDDDFLVTGKRHDFRIDYEVGFDDQGRILAVVIDQAARCGWATDLSLPVCDRAMLHADNAYHLPHARIRSWRCRTNTVSNTAFRGFGGPQGMAGIERVMDHVAHALGLDPLEVRRRNFYDPPGGARTLTPYHMTVEDCVIAEIVDELAESCAYARRRAEIAEWNARNQVIKRGLALTPVKFGISFTLTHLNQAAALVHVYTDGSVHLNHGGTEMGQGLFVKVAQVAAEAFQIDLDRVRITATDTGKAANTSATAASSGSDLNGMAVRDACEKIKRRLTAFAAERFQTSADQVRFLPGRVRVGEEEIAFPDLVRMAWEARVPLSATGFYATPRISWDRAAGRGRPFYYFAYGAAATEAAIDALTGQWRIERVDILHDVGRSLNPAIDLGQIEGGFVQGMGWLTMEELVWDEAGRLRTHAPSTYKIPAAGDRPRHMNIRIWERGENREPTIHRSKAVGEPPLMLGISAWLALSDAAASCGPAYPALDAPATPERVLRAIARARGERWP